MWILGRQEEAVVPAGAIDAKSFTEELSKQGMSTFSFLLLVLFFPFFVCLGKKEAKKNRTSWANTLAFLALTLIGGPILIGLIVKFIRAARGENGTFFIYVDFLSSADSYLSSVLSCRFSSSLHPIPNFLFCSKSRRRPLSSRSLRALCSLSSRRARMTSSLFVVMSFSSLLSPPLIGGRYFWSLEI